MRLFSYTDKYSFREMFKEITDATNLTGLRLYLRLLIELFVYSGEKVLKTNVTGQNVVAYKLCHNPYVKYF